MLLLTVAMAKIHYQMFRQGELAQRITSLGNRLGVVVRRFPAAHNNMSVGIAAGLVDGHLAIFIRRQEHMARPRCTNGVNRDAGIAIRTVFEAYRAGERRRHLTVDLALRSARPDGPPADKIGNKLSGHHIEKLGGGGNAQLIHLQQQLPRQLHAVINPVAAVEIRIGDQTLPAHDGARFLKIGTHDNLQRILMLFAQRL